MPQYMDYIHVYCADIVCDVTWVWCVLADLGLARCLPDGDLALTVCGSPLYMVSNVHDIRRVILSNSCVVFNWLHIR